MTDLKIGHYVGRSRSVRPFLRRASLHFERKAPAWRRPLQKPRMVL